MSSEMKVILVIGGAGALGSALLQTAISVMNAHFFQEYEITIVYQNGSKGICVDLRPSEFAHNIVIKPSDSVDVVMKAMKDELVDTVEAVYCVAGSWQGGSITSPGINMKIERCIEQFRFDGGQQEDVAG